MVNEFCFPVRAKGIESCAKLYFCLFALFFSDNGSVQYGIV